MTDNNQAEAEKALAKVEKETGISRNDQVESLRMLTDIASKKIDLSCNMVDRFSDLAMARENTKVRLAEVQHAENDSKRAYRLADRQLSILEKTLAAHFAQRQETIEKGFEMIDKALDEKNWDAAVKVFGDMSAMVAQSPLAAAIEFKAKIKSGKAITLDDL
jgi:hypothetical protein